MDCIVLCNIYIYLYIWTATSRSAHHPKRARTKATSSEDAHKLTSTHDVRHFCFRRRFLLPSSQTNPARGSPSTSTPSPQAPVGGSFQSRHQPTDRACPVLSRPAPQNTTLAEREAAARPHLLACQPRKSSAAPNQKWPRRRRSPRRPHPAPPGRRHERGRRSPRPRH